MTDLVYLGTPPPYLVIPSTTVREACVVFQPFCTKSPTMKACIGCVGDGFRERTVPVSLDLDAECPTCGGEGTVVAPHVMNPPACPTCSGHGVVPTLWLAEQLDAKCDRCGASYSLPLGMSCSNHNPVRRLAVVARYTVQKLPVKSDSELPLPMPHERSITLTEDGPMWWSWEADGWDWIHRRCTEPWAQGLVPGATVLALGDRIELDEPLTEMWGDADPGALALDGSPEHMAWIPLRLVPGLNTGIELAR